MILDGYMETRERMNREGLQEMAEALRSLQPGTPSRMGSVEVTHFPSGNAEEGLQRYRVRDGEGVLDLTTNDAVQIARMIYEEPVFKEVMREWLTPFVQGILAGLRKLSSVPEPA